MLALNCVRTLVEVNFRKGLLGTRFKESVALWPRTCSPHSTLHGNDEKKERRMRVHAIRSSIRLPLPAAAAGKQAMASRGQKEPREITCRDRAIEAEALVFTPPSGG